MSSAPPAVTLDVRPLLAQGTEPFGHVMEAAAGVPVGGVLELISPFDPTPLHTVLAGRGFDRTTDKAGPAHYVTRYQRVAGAVGAEPSGCGCDHADAEADTEIVLDVRGLQAPIPMERTLAALETLPPGRTLVQINERVPAFLLHHLEETGLQFRVSEDERGTVTRIWRES